MPQKRTKKLLRRSVPFVILCAFLCTSAAVRGASLVGQVIEVNSGDVITILNLNRPVRVRLLGVDAPEMDQAFGDVAKKHLADLVYDKLVLVEYAGIDGDHSLNGRVLLEGADIGAQNLRPPRESFSALVPETGETKTVTIPSADHMTDVHLYRGRDGRSAFVISWLTATTFGEADVEAMKRSMIGFIDAWANSFKN